MMLQEGALGGPDQALPFLIERDDAFSYRDAIEESNDACTGLEARVENKARHETCVKCADVPDRVPYLIDGGTGQDFFLDRCHASLPFGLALVGEYGALGLVEEPRRKRLVAVSHGTFKLKETTLGVHAAGR